MITDTANTRLGRAVASGVAAHPGLSGVRALADPTDAFAARALLIAAADRSLDVQYYIWHNDNAGLLLFEALWHAAGRGVRVRLLLDDNNTAGMDATLAALDAHPNIELRLYNPFLQRHARWLGYLTDFGRLNRRMHNKSLTADNRVTVIGGRNIGDGYFGVGGGVAFADMDVIAVGAAVSEVSKAFDLYWNSASAYPAAALLSPHGERGTEPSQALFLAAGERPQARSYLEAVRTAPMLSDLLAGSLGFEWVETQLLQDDPAKTLDTGMHAGLLLFPGLVRAVGRPQKSLDLVSPYFVPGKAGVEALAAAAGRGVSVRILTNSLAATDVSAVHAGYAKRRMELLRAGVRLYELKPTAEQARPPSGKGRGSSSSSLHAKTFAMDGERLFVGSFNFDPRSALLNTEMGLVIASPAMAGALAAAFDTQVPFIAYEVRLAPDGRSLLWIERGEKSEAVFDSEPGASLLRRLGVGALSLLPIEWLL